MTFPQNYVQRLSLFAVDCSANNTCDGADGIVSSCRMCAAQHEGLVYIASAPLDWKLPGYKECGD
jgi:hypothetical protein